MDMFLFIFVLEVWPCKENTFYKMLRVLAQKQMAAQHTSQHESDCISLTFSKCVSASGLMHLYELLNFILKSQKTGKIAKKQRSKESPGVQ